MTSAPYHATSNGLAERGVQTFKRMMKKCPEGTLTAKVARVLFSYRVTPHSEGKTRKTDKRSQQKAKGHWFKTGDSVLTQNFSLGPKWILEIIESVTGPVSYKVMLGDGWVVRRYADQIHTYHQRPEKCNSNQQAVSIQLSQADKKKWSMVGSWGGGTQWWQVGGASSYWRCWKLRDWIVFWSGPFCNNVQYIVTCVEDNLYIDRMQLFPIDKSHIRTGLVLPGDLQ